MKLKNLMPKSKSVNKKWFQEKYEIVITNLKNKKFISQEQYEQLINVELKKPMTKEVLIEKLVNMGVIIPKEPLDQSFKDFKDDLGSLNAGGLVLFINALRTTKKGLKEMTPIPAKAFPIPAQHLFMIIIGFALFMVIVFPNLASIEKGIGLAAPGAAGSNPLQSLTGMLGIGGKH